MVFPVLQLIDNVWLGRKAALQSIDHLVSKRPPALVGSQHEIEIQIFAQSKGKVLKARIIQAVGKTMNNLGIHRAAAFLSFLLDAIAHSLGKPQQQFIHIITGVSRSGHVNSISKNIVVAN
ncbi:hypothetical protein D9M72_586430 [compost metagenome]